MSTYQHFRLKEHDSTALLKACVKTLNRGGLAILPTETVYGVGAKEGSRRGKHRLHQLKEDRTNPYSRAVCTPEMASQQWENAGSLTKRLMTAFWPGPLTIIAPGRNGKTIGLRCPDHPWTRRLIQDLNSPILLPSANLHGQPAPASIEEISPQVLGAVKIVIDDGPCPSQTPSTVVAVGDTLIRVLREGALSIRSLRSQARPTLLVVCSGNTCRSPMASALIAASFQAATAENQMIPPKVISAGIHAPAGTPPSQNACRCLKERGIDISHQTSQPLTEELLQSADLTLAMTEEHLQEIRATYPNISINADLFDPTGTEVQDPFGQDLEGYRRTAEILSTLAATRVAQSVHPEDVT